MKQPGQIFLDTSYVQAYFSKDDAFHLKARELYPLLRNSRKVWITEAILLEIGDAFSGGQRNVASAFARECYETNNFEVVTVDTPLMKKALDLYDKRPDKTWGMVDCVSFVVMKENRIKEALTSDKHFVQAGFQALLLN